MLMQFYLFTEVEDLNLHTANFTHLHFKTETNLSPDSAKKYACV